MLKKNLPSLPSLDQSIHPSHSPTPWLPGAVASKATLGWFLPCYGSEGRRPRQTSERLRKNRNPETGAEPTEADLPSTHPTMKERLHFYVHFGVYYFALQNRSEFLTSGRGGDSRSSSNSHACNVWRSRPWCRPLKPCI